MESNGRIVGNKFSNITIILITIIMIIRIIINYKTVGIGGLSQRFWENRWDRVDIPTVLKTVGIGKAIPTVLKTVGIGEAIPTVFSKPLG